MVVRSSNDRKVECVGEPDDVRAFPLRHSDPLGCRVTQLHRVQSRETVQLIFRNECEIAGNGENEKRRRAGGRNAVRRERGTARTHRIVPVAFWIERKRGVDADRDDVLVFVARLECRQQHGAVARPCRVARRCRNRTGEGLVIADVRDVESGPGVPRTVALRCEPPATVPGRVGVTVEVDRDIVRVVQLYRGHRTRNERAAAVHDQDPGERCERDAGLSRNRSARATAT